MQRLYFGIIVIVLLSTNHSCTKLPSVGGNELPQYSVLCVLNNLEKRNHLRLSRVVPGNDTIRPVSNAKVAISWAGGHVEFTEDSANAGLYLDKAPHLVLHPQTDYVLQVQMNGQWISGKTHTPEIPKIVKPQWADTVFAGIKIGENWSYFNFTVSWKKARDAAGYLTILFHNPVELDSEYWYSPPPSTFVSFEMDSIELKMWDRSSLDRQNAIAVAAIDSNLYGHVFKGKDQMGLSHALGVFGSALADSVRFFLHSPKKRR